MIDLANVDMIFDAGLPDENIALQNVNLTIKAGDFVTIIGSNGAGKSTLFNVIAGSRLPSAGRIFITNRKTSDTIDGRAAPDTAAASRRNIKTSDTVDGRTASSDTATAPATAPRRDITREAEYKRARYIGRIFQNPLLGTAGKMTLEANMMLCHKKGYKSLRISLNKQMRDEFRDQLRILGMGLENRLNDNVELFSGGQRQALTLLMTVMSRPSLLLLDEHTAALDPRNAELIMSLTLRFAREYHLTVMMITHNMAHAVEYGNRLLMMDSGEVILDIDEAEKAHVTTDDIVQRFRDIKKRDLTSDKMLLA